MSSVDLIPVALLSAEDGGYLQVVNAVTYLPEDDPTSATILTRAGADGSTCWTTSMDGRPRAAVSAPDGGWVVAGSNQRKAWVTKFVDDGTLQWERVNTWEDDSEILAIACTADGGFVFSGNLDNQSIEENQKSEIYLSHLDADGVPVLETSCVVSRGDIWDCVTGIADADDTLFIITTSSRITTDPNGTVLSVERWPHDFSAAFPVQDGFVVAGSVLHNHRWVQTLIKMDPDGSIIWERQYEELEPATIDGLVEGSHGEIVAFGTCSYNRTCPPFTESVTDSLVMVFGPDGELRGQKTSGYPGIDMGRGIVTTDDGYLLLAEYVTPLEKIDEYNLRFLASGTALFPVSGRR
ncbi:hypothetical protein RJ40_03320 [Methanofollis aquaemaris]|uniref:PQQ-binding-like beta-propeller repeat protein n=1 Tax=Methanofollis aquaemaris TaxID=126734 RepID=A0A8A3S380_9EURY|nr:hypothetical protein [Methanofollis aquaemaris]QSZ66595.1 hypothetical protein RJ40_03320 [Methanofollis aquaemaris]